MWPRSIPPKPKTATLEPAGAVLHQAATLGGRVRSVEFAGGFVADQAQFFAEEYTWTLKLLDEVGLRDHLIEIDQDAFFALFRDGRV